MSTELCSFLTKSSPNNEMKCVPLSTNDNLILLDVIIIEVENNSSEVFIKVYSTQKLTISLIKLYATNICLFANFIDSIQNKTFCTFNCFYNQYLDLVKRSCSLANSGTVKVLYPQGNYSANKLARNSIDAFDAKIAYYTMKDNFDYDIDGLIKFCAYSGSNQAKYLNILDGTCTDCTDTSTFQLDPSIGICNCKNTLIIKDDEDLKNRKFSRECKSDVPSLVS